MEAGVSDHAWSIEEIIGLTGPGRRTARGFKLTHYLSCWLTFRITCGPLGGQTGASGS